MDNTADVIIIGGGVNGVSLAFHLARRDLKVLILEKRFLAAEATGHSSGLVRMHYDLEAESRLAWASFQYFRNWSHMVGGDCGFRRTGFIQIVRPEYEDALRENVKMHQQIGIPTFLITSEDVRRLAPEFVTDDFSIAAYEPESGYADPSSTTRSFIEAARLKGANLVQDCQVSGIKVEAGRVKGVETNQGAFFAPLVVNAAGAWAARIGRMAGLEVPVETWRHETLFIRRPPELGPSHPTVIDDALSMYFRPETGGLTLVGLEDSNVIGEDPENGSDRARVGFVERAVERICRRVPVMEKGSLHSTLAG